MHHDLVLIVDFGSQVTQLIARRVREAGVYCEIHPFSKAAEAFERLGPEGGDLLGRPGLGSRSRQPARAGVDLRGGRSHSRHLLRPADARRATRREGRERPRGGIWPSRGASRRNECALRRRVGEGRPLSGLDEPRRPGDAAARRLPGLRRLGECALRRRRGREAPLLHHHVPSRGRPYARWSETDRQLPAQGRRPRGRLDHGRLPRGGDSPASAPRSAGVASSAASPAGSIRRSRRC